MYFTAIPLHQYDCLNCKAIYVQCGDDFFNADGSIEDGLLLSLPNCRCDYLDNILLEHNLIFGVNFVWGSDEHDVYVNICLIQKWCSCCEMLRVGKWQIC